MVERTVRSIDPLMYHVNSVSDFEPELVVAYKNKDKKKLERLLKVNRYDYDVFICVNEGCHAFVMCVDVSKEPDRIGWYLKCSDIPEESPVFLSQLRFESEVQRTYKITPKMGTYKNIKDTIQKPYYIGRYKNVAAERAFQLAALDAAPTRYKYLLDDCVEFAKEFCIRLLSYCDNWKTLEKSVEDAIKKATATGLSAEQLSRRVKSSAHVMNSLLVGVDVTTVFSGRSGPITVASILVYHVIYAVIAYMITVNLMK